MTSYNEEQEELLNKIKNKYSYDNGYIIGIPDSSPQECLAANYHEFKKSVSSYEISKKIDDILMEYEILKEEIDDESEEWEEIEDLDEMEEESEDYFVSVKQLKRTKKIEKEIRKDPKKKRIVNELIKIYDKVDIITEEAYNNFSYYFEVIDQLLEKYKEKYWFEDVGKIYNNTTREIIALMNDKYINYEKNLICLIDNLKQINLKLIK